MSRSRRMRSGARQRDLRQRVRAFKAEVEAALAPYMGRPYTPDLEPEIQAALHKAFWRLAMPRPIRWVVRGTVTL